MTEDVDIVARDLAVECYAFCASRLARRVHRVYDTALRPFGIRNQQLSVLRAAGRSPGLRPIDLARILGAEKSTVTRVLTTLQDHGLVDVRTMRGNGRQKAVWLTPVGRSRLAEATPAWMDAQRQVEQILGPMSEQLREAALS